jgi:arylformamidase
MEAKIEWSEKSFKVDFGNPRSIGITLNNGDANPNCYFADPVSFEVIRTNDFVGSISEGGNVNHKKIVLSPHGNGTHTECSGHIYDNKITIADILSTHIHVGHLLSVDLEKNSEGDLIIGVEELRKSLIPRNISALVIRTRPNTKEKCLRNYSGSNPPYLSRESMAYIVKNGIEHLIVDLPSVDKEVDGGALINHNQFWANNDGSRSHCTITELAYIEDSIVDGTYLIDFQCLKIALDVSPSNPVLYSLSPI